MNRKNLNKKILASQVETFAEVALEKPSVRAEANLTVEEWRAIYEYEFLGCIMPNTEETLNSAQKKVAEFYANLPS